MITIFETLINKFAWNGILNLFFIIINLCLGSYYLLRGCHIKIKKRKIYIFSYKKIFSTTPYLRLFQYITITIILIIEICYIFALYTWYLSSSYIAVREIGIYGLISDIGYIIAENIRAAGMTIILIMIKKIGRH